MSIRTICPFHYNDRFISLIPSIKLISYDHLHMVDSFVPAIGCACLKHEIPRLKLKLQSIFLTKSTLQQLMTSCHIFRLSRRSRCIGWSPEFNTVFGIRTPYQWVAVIISLQHALRLTVLTGGWNSLGTPDNLLFLCIGNWYYTAQTDVSDLCTDNSIPFLFSRTFPFPKTDATFGRLDLRWIFPL